MGKGLGAKYIKAGKKALVKRAGAVIVLTESAKSYFKGSYGRDTVIIPNGIKKPQGLGG